MSESVSPAGHDYQAFLASKQRIVAPSGFDVAPEAINPTLFPFQRDVVRWALKRGRAAIFEDTGLGKSRQLCEWSKHVVAHTGGNVLILAPLAVAKQTVKEGAAIGVEIRYCRAQAEVQPGITITNYQMLHAFDPSEFVGVVPDESGIIKHSDSATRNQLMDAFARTPYKLCCTATPAPNDYVELGNHAQFLGVMSQVEMLSMFFVHDGGSTQDWRLKGHAQDAFWRFLAEWSVMIGKPSDLGYADDGYILPPLTMHEHRVDADHTAAQEAGMLFSFEARTLNDQRAARRASLQDRVQVAANLAQDGNTWLFWCELNAEADALVKAIPGAIQVQGSDSLETKERVLLDFAEGRLRVLVGKPSIFGFGLNLQICHHVGFVGIGHSYEQFYQAIRRCWRFGQTKPVDCHIIISEAEGAVLANIKRKEADAQRMKDAMVEHMAGISTQVIRGASRQTDAYNPTVPMQLPTWLVSEKVQ